MLGRHAVGYIPAFSSSRGRQLSSIARRHNGCRRRGASCHRLANNTRTRRLLSFTNTDSTSFPSTRECSCQPGQMLPAHTVMNGTERQQLTRAWIRRTWAWQDGHVTIGLHARTQPLNQRHASSRERANNAAAPSSHPPSTWLPVLWRTWAEKVGGRACPLQYLCRGHPCCWPVLENAKSASSLAAHLSHDWKLLKLLPPNVRF